MLNAAIDSNDFSGLEVALSKEQSTLDFRLKHSKRSVSCPFRDPACITELYRRVPGARNAEIVVSCVLVSD